MYKTLLKLTSKHDIPIYMGGAKYCPDCAAFPIFEKPKASWIKSST